MIHVYMYIYIFIYIYIPLRFSVSIENERTSLNEIVDHTPTSMNPNFDDSELSNSIHSPHTDDSSQILSLKPRVVRTTAVTIVVTLYQFLATRINRSLIGRIFRISFNRGHLPRHSRILVRAATTMPAVPEAGAHPDPSVNKHPPVWTHPILVSDKRKLYFIKKKYI